MTKILVVTNDLRQGLGITEWIRHYYNKLVLKSDIDVSIIVESGHVDIPTGYFNKQIKIVCFAPMKNHPFRYAIDWLKNLKYVKKYDYIHFHTDNVTKFFPLLLLKNKNNVIVHSHNSTNVKVENSRVKTIMNNVGKRIIKNSNFIKFACSDTAARWLFGNEAYIQVNNGVEISDFKFDSVLRDKYRKMFNLKHNYTFVHVGRFSQQKNQLRLIKIFAQVHLQRPESKLLLIGKGDLEETIKAEIKANGLNGVVRLLGYRDDVKDIMNAADAVIFPSLYEGLPISLIEAQVNGVPVFYSSTITSEVKILSTSTSFDLTASNQKIANDIVRKMKPINVDQRKLAPQAVRAAGYADTHTVSQLYTFYRQKTK